MMKTLLSLRMLLMLMHASLVKTWLKASSRKLDELYSDQCNKLLSCHLRKIVIPRGFLNLQPVLR